RVLEEGQQSGHAVATRPAVLLVHGEHGKHGSSTSADHQVLTLLRHTLVFFLMSGQGRSEPDAPQRRPSPYSDPVSERMAVGVLGARGKVGREVCRAVEAADDLDLRARVDTGPHDD